MTRIFADLSSNNGQFDPAAYRAAGHLLVALKATEGVGFTDPTHEERARRAHAAGLVVMHYHFARPERHRRGHDEARFFAGVVKPLLGPHDVVALDLEREPIDGMHTAARYGQEYAGTVHELLPKRPQVGYSDDGFLTAAGPALAAAFRRWWQANFNPGHSRLPRLGGPWARQFTDGAIGDRPHAAAGVGPCDLSVLNRRTYHHLRRIAHHHERTHR